MKKQYWVIACLCTLFLLWGCGQTPKRIELRGEAQGTYYSIIYYDPCGRNLQGAIDTLLASFDQTASLWIDNSLIRRINRNETDTLNQWMADMLKKSLDMCDYTEGCFDCRVGRLVQAWGFSFKQKEPLSQERIDSLLLMARGRISIDTTADGVMLIRKEYPETELDFNAIAQGYSVDLIAKMLDSLGINTYLVDIGGEVITKGEKPHGERWTVGIERPAENKYSDRELETAITVTDLSVVTSGNYRKYYEKEGVRYSHTIDPTTGYPVQHSLLSATVIDYQSWRADALATAMMVMGKDRALEFAAKHPEDLALQRLYFIYSDKQGYSTFATPQFQEFIK